MTHSKKTTKQVSTIKELVQLSLNNAAQHVVCKIGKVTAIQAKKIEQLIGVNLKGSERFIDSYDLLHCLARHGSEKSESRHGQVAVTLDDFELVPSILQKPDKIEYEGKNSMRQDLIKYTKRIGNLYMVVEAVRVRKDGNRLFFKTMYKKR